MLVLSRKRHETILIGDNIEVSVVQIGNGSVRIGIVAPRDVNVVRSELVPQTAHEEPQKDSRNVERSS
jgi:carbon storage regulator